MKRSNWKEFDSILSMHKIDRLYHFTDRRNLDSIVKNRGLLSWADCEEKGIKILAPGGDKASHIYDERDNLHHYVRLSFTQQHPMMFVAKRDGRIKEPIILEIDKNVIFDDSTLFSNMNAVKQGASVGGAIYDFKKIHFQTISRRSYFDLSDIERPFYQAEVLVKNYLPIECILNLDNLGIDLPSDIAIKSYYGKRKYLYDREAVDFLSECLWDLTHTTYLQGVSLSNMIFEMLDNDNSLQIHIRGILDSEGMFHLVVTKKQETGICSVSLDHFINLLVSLNMFDEGMKRKISILLNQ